MVMHPSDLLKNRRNVVANKLILMLPAKLISVLPNGEEKKTERYKNNKRDATLGAKWAKKVTEGGGGRRARAACAGGDKRCASRPRPTVVVICTESRLSATGFINKSRGTRTGRIIPIFGDHRTNMADRLVNRLERRVRRRYAVFPDRNVLTRTVRACLRVDGSQTPALPRTVRASPSGVRSTRKNGNRTYCIRGTGRRNLAQFPSTNSDVYLLSDVASFQREYVSAIG